MSDHDRVRKASAARPTKTRKRIQAKLEVGAVDDPLEAEADAMADRLMASIKAGPSQGPAEGQRTEEEDLLQGSRSIQRMEVEEEEELMQGSRSIQRTNRMEEEELQGSRVARATIGAEGGEVDPDLEARLRSGGGGAALPDPLKSTMESTFDADLSAVRVHENPAATEIAARAYAMGTDIHFAPGAYKPDAPDGQRLIAHEAWHVVQQSSGVRRRSQAEPVLSDGDVAARQSSLSAVHSSVQRSTALINRWPWSKKKPKPMEISGPMGISETDRPEGWFAQTESGSLATDEEASEEAAWSGKAGNMNDGVTAEIGKPAAAGVATGAGEGIGAAAGASGVGMPVLGGLLAIDTAIGLNNANKMHNEGQQFGDGAMTKMGARKAKDQGTAGGKAAIGAAKGGVAAAKGVAANAADTAALGAAGAGLGIAAGGVQIIQGAWRGGKAVMKLCRLTWGRGAEMLSAQGAKWKSYVQNREGLKAAINATKVAVGALGVAAGALMLASNPIGWSIAIAAGVAGGIFAITKIVGKISNASAKKSARQKIEAGARAEASAPMDTEAFLAELAAVEAAKAEGAETASEPEPEPEAAEAPEPEQPASAVEGADPALAAKRSEAIARANEVARAACSTAATAHEMREALRAGNRDLVNQYIDVKALPKQSEGEFGDESVWVAPEDVMSEQLAYDLVAMMAAEDKEFHDALMILSSLNVDQETALSDSGQDLIASKLNLTEAM